MTTTRLQRLRTFWWVTHRWIGLILTVLLVPVAVSGALLVWHDEIDTVLNPSRYAVSGAEVALTPDQYLASAATVMDADLQATGIRYPRDEGWPVMVVTRQRPTEGQRPQFFTIFLDPPTGKVLDKMNFRESFIGFLHIFHENLTIPQYSGRAIVGWTGVAMLILSLTGIWLWWPRNGAFLLGLRWRRAPQTSTNLHHIFGFWISLPLAAVSLTGIYLSFPQTARSVMSSIAPMGQQQRPSFAAQVVRQPALSAEQALRLAVETVPDAKPGMVFLPVPPSREGAANRSGGHEQAGREQGGREPGGREQGGREQGGPVWRVQLRTVNDNTVTVMVDDRRGTATRQPDPLAGDRAAQWIRWIHDGSRGGVVWQTIVFLTGVLPLVFAVSGVMMWLRGRRGRKALAAVRNGAIRKSDKQNTEAGTLQAAE